MDNFPGGIFIGDDLAYQQFLKNNPEIEKEVNKNKRESLGQTKTTTRISSSDITPISEDDLNILKRTRTRHEYDVVYMQPDISFYDKFYLSNESDNDSAIPEDILNAAKRIKRIYRGNYLKYLDACIARDNYIDALIDSYGGELMFELARSSGRCKDWIPPVPKYAKNSMDYDMVMSGVIDTSSFSEVDPDISKTVENMVVPEGEANFTIGPCKDKVHNDMVNSVINNENHHNSSYKQFLNRAVINISEADILKSFNIEMGYDDKKDNNNDKLLSETPEALAERFYTDGVTSSDGKLTKVFNGEDIETTDDNIRVYDKVTGKYMSKKELESRETIRHMAQVSDWSEHKLMTMFNVGTRSERELMERNERRMRNNKKKKKASGSMPETDIFGSSFDDFVENISLDEFMRGD